MTFVFSPCFLLVALEFNYLSAQQKTVLDQAVTITKYWVSSLGCDTTKGSNFVEYKLPRSKPKLEKKESGESLTKRNSSDWVSGRETGLDLSILQCKIPKLARKECSTGAPVAISMSRPFVQAAGSGSIPGGAIRGMYRIWVWLQGPVQYLSHPRYTRVRNDRVNAPECCCTQ